MSPPLICIVGPTAGGKSALAMALAETFPLEIISMDSAQVYRGMDIGTAKPDRDDRARVPHHLIDILDPADSYSAAAFAADAAALITAIHGRGKLACLVGGTFLYLRALLQGLSGMPGANPALRAELEQAAASAGWPALHARLTRLDPQAAARIHPNDGQRIQRALEIHALSGASRSAHHAAGTVGWPGPALKLAVAPVERGELRARIATRFQGMMAAGFLDEVAALHRRADLHAGLPAVRAVGYRQLWHHLDGHCTLDEAVEKGIIASRQYAKRQLTWLRRESALHWLHGPPHTLSEAAAAQVRKFLRKLQD